MKRFNAIVSDITHTNKDVEKLSIIAAMFSHASGKSSDKKRSPAERWKAAIGHVITRLRVANYTQQLERLARLHLTQKDLLRQRQERYNAEQALALAAQPIGTMRAVKAFKGLLNHEHFEHISDHKTKTQLRREYLLNVKHRWNTETNLSDPGPAPHRSSPTYAEMRAMTQQSLFPGSAASASMAMGINMNMNMNMNMNTNMNMNPHLPHLDPMSSCKGDSIKKSKSLPNAPTEY
jgi:hypothetical protein